MTNQYRKAPTVSLILPVYNVEEYMDQCMESVAAQTFSDFEVILINDGSTDRSGEVCRRWQSRDARIRYIETENRGVSAARNRGIEEAKGRYLAFVDPDDWLDRDYLKKLYEEAEKTDADYTECDLWRVNGRNGTMIRRSCAGQMGRRFLLPEHMKYGPTASYKAISKRDLWIRNGIRFPSCSFESPAVYALILAAAEKTAYLPEALYYYRRFREGSLVETAYSKDGKKPDLYLGIEAMRHLVAEFKRLGLYDRYHAVLPEVVAYRLNDILAMQFHRQTEEDFRLIVKHMRDYLAEEFPQTGGITYFTLGGYNLAKALTGMPVLHDPSRRYGFSSLIALTDGDGPREPFSHPNRYRELMLEKERKRSFWTDLEAEKPDYIILDLMEERHPIAVECGCLMTKSDAYDGAGRSPESVIPRDTEESEARWKEAFDRFAEKAARLSPDTRLIVSEDYLAETHGRTANEPQPYENREELARTNRMLKRMYEYIRKTNKAAAIVPAWQEVPYMTDDGFEYGARPEHLNHFVNEAIAGKIMAAIRNCLPQEGSLYDKSIGIGHHSGL